MKKAILILLCFAMLVVAVSCNHNIEGDIETSQSVSSSSEKDKHTSGSQATTTGTLPDVLIESPIEDFEYKENEDGGITITRYIGQSSNVIIPKTIQGKEITKIGINAFRLNIATSVSMPNTITEISGEAFYQCDKLESVILSTNLIKIGGSAFQECTQLKHITIPSRVIVIGDFAFESSGIETIAFEEGIKNIGGYGCFAKTQLKQIVLPSTVREIGRSTFAACPNLESLILNEGLVTIGHKAFVNNPKLKKIIIPKTVKFVTEIDFDMCSELREIMFEGNAPSTFEYSDEISGVWEPNDVHFTVYYHEGAKGFTSPEWYGYPTEIW